MATYSPQSLGITAPAGGFQQGGWYNGRQYWGGTLSEPGQIHQASNQVGAGQNVSNQVIAQTNPANVPYIEQQRQQAVAKPVQPVQATGMATPGAGAGYTAGQGIGQMTATQPTLDLPSLYQSAYKTAGIADVEKMINEKTQAFNQAMGVINDNPYYSEARRVGKAAKLQQQYDADVAALKNDVAMRKADIETQLNLQTKQFDINSQATKMALDRFNSLLESGALSGASGEDIANITRSTGISSQMIQSAIDASKNKNVKTQVITSTDDNGNVTATVVNTNTGEIIAKNSLGAIGNAEKGTKQSATEKVQQMQADFINDFEKVKNSYGHVGPSTWQQAMAAWIAQGGSRDEFINNFRQYADPNRGDFTAAYGFKKLEE